MTMKEQNNIAVDIFSGGGGLSLGIEESGFVVKLAVDKWEPAIETYNHNRKDKVGIVASVSDLKGDDIKATCKTEEIALVGGGPPCFVGNTLVITNNGYKPISDLKKGDLVLTHLGKYKPVLQVMKRKYKGNMISMKLKGNHDEYICTPEHPMLVKEYGRKNTRGSTGKLYPVKTAVKDGFIPASEIKPNSCYLALPIVQESEIPVINGYYLDNKKEKIPFAVDLPYDNEDFWYLMGFYVAEGWYHKSGRNRKKSVDPKYRSPRYEVMFSVNGKEKDTIRKMLEKFFNVYESHSGTCFRLTISSKDLWWFVKNFGKNAHDKHVPEFVHKLPEHLVKKFCDGYIKGDGSKVNVTGYIKFYTVSPRLCKDLIRLIAKSHRRYVTYHVRKGGENHTIQGRKINSRDGFNLSFRQDAKTFVNWIYDDENKYIWIKVDEVKEVFKETIVWNIEVQDDNTFCTPIFTTHNCPGYSSAGKRDVMDPRNLMVDEYFRIIKEIRPRYFLMENVPGMQSMIRPDGKTNVIDWIASEIEIMKYHFKWEKLLASSYGVPQNRQRLIFVGWRDDMIAPFFPPTPTHAKFHYKTVFNETILKYKTVRQAFRSIPEDAPNQDLVYEFKKEDYIEKVKKLKPGESVYEYGDSHRKLDWKKPAFTIKENHGSIAIHPEEIRMINLREMATLQDFPFDYEFIGNNRVIAKIIGNAVPRGLARSIAMEIMKVNKHANND